MRSFPLRAPISSRLSVPIILSAPSRSEEHTSELQSRLHLVCRLLLEKKKTEIPVLDRPTLPLTFLLLRNGARPTTATSGEHTVTCKPLSQPPPPHYHIARPVHSIPSS